MRIISAIRRQDLFFGIASVDKGGALDVSGAARDLRLKIFDCLATISSSKLCQSMVGQIAVDSSFCCSSR